MSDMMAFFEPHRRELHVSVAELVARRKAELSKAVHQWAWVDLNYRPHAYQI